MLRLSKSELPELISRNWVLLGLLELLRGRGVGVRLTCPKSEVVRMEELEGLALSGWGSMMCIWLCGLCGRRFLPERGGEDERREEDTMDIGRGFRRGRGEDERKEGFVVDEDDGRRC